MRATERSNTQVSMMMYIFPRIIVDGNPFPKFDVPVEIPGLRSERFLQVNSWQRWRRAVELSTVHLFLFREIESTFGRRLRVRIFSVTCLRSCSSFNVFSRCNLRGLLEVVHGNADVFTSDFLFLRAPGRSLKAGAIFRFAFRRFRGSDRGQESMADGLKRRFLELRFFVRERNRPSSRLLPLTQKFTPILTQFQRLRRFFSLDGLRQLLPFTRRTLVLCARRFDGSRVVREVFGGLF